MEGRCRDDALEGVAGKDEAQHRHRHVMPIRSAPFTSSTESTATMMKPITASTTSGLCRSPSADQRRRAAAMMPAFLSEMIARRGRCRP